MFNLKAILNYTYVFNYHIKQPNSLILHKIQEKMGCFSAQIRERSLKLKSLKPTAFNKSINSAQIITYEYSSPLKYLIMLGLQKKQYYQRGAVHHD